MNLEKEPSLKGVNQSIGEKVVFLKTKEPNLNRSSSMCDNFPLALR